MELTVAITGASGTIYAHRTLQLLAASGMVDVYRQLHPDERGYTWISRARPHRLDAARVDYAVVSAELAARVTDAAIVEPPLDRGRSDHRVVTVTVRL